MNEYYFIFVWMAGIAYLSMSMQVKEKIMVLGKMEWRWNIIMAIIVFIPVIHLASMRAPQGDMGVYLDAYVKAEASWSSVFEAIKAPKIVCLISRAILFLVPKEERAQKRKKDLRFITAFNDCKLPRVTIETLTTMRQSLPPNLMDHFTECEFEGEQYPVFEKWNEYLKCKYRDYMSLPPESERVWKQYRI